MKKFWPLLALLAAVAVVILVLDPFSKPATVVIDDATRTDGAAPVAPNLAAAPKGSVRPTPDRSSEMEGEGESVAPPAPEGAAFSGVVLDDATGAPVPAARVGVEMAGGECPRLPDADPHQFFPTGAPGDHAMSVWRWVGHHDQFGGTTFAAGTAAGADGTFRIEWKSPEASDLFVRAPGYIFACVCGITTAASPITVRLKRGAEIRGLVVQANGQPVEGATIDAKPGPGTPNLPGHLERAQSGKDGAFVLTGLLPGALVLTADHPKFMPVTLAPMPPGGAPIRIVLIPALVTTFKITTDNGREPKSPSLAWTTSSTPPKSGLLILAKQVGGESDASPAGGPGTAASGAWVEPLYGPVKIPCDAPDATFDVKAIGYSPWKSEPVPLPPDGGEKTIDVRLDRDLTLGTMKLTFEDRDGKALSYTAEKMEAGFWRRDNRDVPGGIVTLPSDTLYLPALPAGPYGVQVHSPGHAPAIFSIDSIAGVEGEQRVVLGPPAKLRVKFTSAEATMVQFQVLWNDRVALAFPEGTDVVSQSKDSEGGAVFNSEGQSAAEGLLLSGLASGKHVIRVTSPDLVPSSTAVDLAEGETREIEIAVAKK